ncbi:MAG: hypothetical protein FWG29_03075 [Treponema sp.]|nr:hypothetical protein [Treponema sp.]
MKKNVFLLVTVLITVLLAGCATFNQEGVAQGKYFSGYKGEYDPSKPIEEQCVLINLADKDLFITHIDGEKARDNFGMANAPATSIVNNAFIILQPGSHSLSLYYGESTAGGYSEGKTGGRFDFEPGQYYFITGGPRGNQLSVSFGNLADYMTVPVYGSSVFTREQVPVASVIDGINAVIKKGLKK